LIENVDVMDGTHLVPVSLGEYTVYLSVPVTRLGDEEDIVARAPDLDSMLGGIAAFAAELTTRLRTTDVSKISVEFGCEFGVESGGFVAVIGKASAKSAVKVGLEWVKPTT
jgi:hypothetical protein